MVREPLRLRNTSGDTGGQSLQAETVTKTVAAFSPFIQTLEKRSRKGGKGGLVFALSPPLYHKQGALRNRFRARRVPNLVWQELSQPDVGTFAFGFVVPEQSPSVITVSKQPKRLFERINTAAKKPAPPMQAAQKVSDFRVASLDAVRLTFVGQCLVRSPKVNQSGVVRVV